MARTGPRAPLPPCTPDPGQRPGTVRGAKSRTAGMTRQAGGREELATTGRGRAERPSVGVSAEEWSGAQRGETARTAVWGA